MSERDPAGDVAAAAEQLAAAIGRRDAGAIRMLLAPGFVHRTHGGPTIAADAFVRAVEQIPGEILLVRLEQLNVDLAGRGALVTGVQHAQVLVNGRVVDERRGFVDWFVHDAGVWRIQAAVDLP